MFYYDNEIIKKIKKRLIPKQIFRHINNVFISLEKTKDFRLFDIKKIKGNKGRNYFRLRKGDYRAIFYVEDDDLYIIALDKREEVYKKWL